MAISIHLKASNPDLENLLLFLDRQNHLSPQHKVILLEQATAWLKLGLKRGFCLDLGNVSAAKLEIDGVPLLGQGPSDTPAQHSQAKYPSPDSPDALR